MSNDITLTDIPLLHINRCNFSPPEPCTLLGCTSNVALTLLPILGKISVNFWFLRILYVDSCAIKVIDWWCINILYVETYRWETNNFFHIITKYFRRSLAGTGRTCNVQGLAWVETEITSCLVMFSEVGECGFCPEDGGRMFFGNLGNHTNWGVFWGKSEIKHSLLLPTGWCQKKFLIASHI